MEMLIKMELQMEMHTWKVTQLELNLVITYTDLYGIYVFVWNTFLLHAIEFVRF